MTDRRPTLAGKAYWATLSPLEKIESLNSSQQALIKSAFDYIDNDTFAKIGNFVIDWVANHSNATQKDFDDMLSQVAQPKGGTENLTNVASPGQPPAKVAAVPGESGGYGKPGSAIGKPSNDWYDSTGTYSGRTYTSTGLAGVSSPQEKLETNVTRDDYAMHGPVGTAGSTDEIPTYESRIIPGSTAPKNQYSRFPRYKIPKDPTPDPASVKSLAPSDNSLFMIAPRSTTEILETTRNKPNSKRTTIGTGGLYNKGKIKRDIAGDFEGDDLTLDSGADQLDSPDQTPNRTYDISDTSAVGDGTSTGDQGDYGYDYSAVDSSPDLGKREEDDEGLVRISDEAARLDEEARKAESKGYRAHAIVLREKAANLRRSLPVGYYLKSKSLLYRKALR